MDQSSKKEEYAKQICLFLAELLRTRKISLKRAAEIAERVIQNINLIDSEAQFLGLIKELTSDFQELFNLNGRISFRIDVNKRLLMENQVREFVVSFLARDVKLALAVLEEAVKENAGVDNLYLKFPQFEEFIQTKP
ncbi:MAG: hypothetical protein A3J07_03110 [Candidatus Doudnabacteria bacterium RIFCSPLOWO2_02_FULL_49_13]|uniref:Uncharacterized protein n=1 Tax=Candidatus Doudnabacteria bacterium RIFCSPHIGHO2_12_FULL_48_16 TaxID=1817838 RepID=A0A1F5PLP9_9BACT|nr:MAG: hypothetical protein A3B77_01915 [Candidatus Doudnabacteria bacterium RIFCSPHIGHO2_02_FULL_49_24]OGE89436.1 MAG: hypothetical protein A2760_02360 [Candidatus Doudnabacteria bacterium RIFCSPHIGHO2_01_FULL_50_67]OGE90831.1 MAG: hypothetical protein A3E29_01520 [Candidatus Doudnabacteria bacterium RIFCSPHIGHO2_12_FULL_48_16]OGE97542.1 MAG: hypothetical protein A2990_02380 [Candidatus Doudnabacteria bacterium RIFCSPLOWO2_01_FULL_49_40]OGF03054.1 MAG: hypothetical protein A3J07_03110 [Candid